MFCGKCGVTNDDNAFKCVACGGELHSSAGTPNTAPQSIPTADIQTAPTNSPLAVVSLVTGIVGLLSPCCGLFFISSLAAIVCGHIAYAQITREPDKFSGRGMAIAGFVLGYCGILFVVAGLICFGAMRILGRHGQQY